MACNTIVVWDYDGVIEGMRISWTVEKIGIRGNPSLGVGSPAFVVFYFTRYHTLS
jgi:hypothetical protein